MSDPEMYVSDGNYESVNYSNMVEFQDLTCFDVSSVRQIGNQ